MRRQNPARAAHGRPALPPEEYALLHRRALERDGYRCQNPLCRRPERGTPLHVDHIKDRSQGGPDTLENLVTLCWVCHDLKGRGIVLVLTDGSGVVRFHDLRQFLRCEGCERAFEVGELMAVPTATGGIRWRRYPQLSPKHNSGRG